MQPLEHAQTYHRAGLSVIPIKPDGTKAPAVSSWKPFQDRRATEQELPQLFSGTVGIAVVCGRVSGNLLAFDFEAGAPVKEWGALVREQLGYDFVKRLTIIETPTGGRHVLVKVPEGPDYRNEKLAQTEGGNGQTRVLIETRASGGYFITVGSPDECHPLRKPYSLLQGDLQSIPDIGADQAELMLACARSFNEHLKPQRTVSDTPAITPDGNRPGDEYNARGPGWGEILKPHGWQLLFERNGTAHWTRPGKDRRQGGSATTNHNGSGLLYIFSSNAAPFEPETSYPKFAAHALLNHAGDFSAAPGSSTITATAEIPQDWISSKRSSTGKLPNPGMILSHWQTASRQLNR